MNEAALRTRPDSPAAVVVGAGLALLGLCVWVVHQGGVALADPGAWASLAGLILIVFNASPLLAAWWLGAAGYGYALRQRGVAQVGVGMAALLLLNYLAGFVLGFSGGIAWGLCGLGVGLLGVQAWRAWRKTSSASRDAFRLADLRLNAWWLLGIPGAAMLIVAACCPPSTMWRVEALGYDALSYHLQIPREWVAAGGMVELEHTVYAYLPGLMEAAFAALISMRGGTGGTGGAGGGAVESVYTCQLFHASFAVLAAIGVASLLRDQIKGKAAAVASAGGGALVLLVPWVIVTGASAYNEMVVVAFAAVGLGLLTKIEKPCGRIGVAVGLLAGAATLAKLTAAFTVALPLGGVLVWRIVNDWRKYDGLRTIFTPAALCVVVGCAALSPYLVRNAAWTGNPVFPFAGERLGYGHWDEARAARWDAAHMPDTPWADRWGAVSRQAVGNTGYGAWGGSDTIRDAGNVARFAKEGGLPVLWLAAGAGLAWGLAQRKTRWFAGVLGVVLLGQFVWWLSMTHLQSRFLVVAIVPLCAAAGLLFGLLSRFGFGSRLSAGGLLAIVLAVVTAVVALTTTWSQSTFVTMPDGQRFGAPLWLIVDGLPAPHGLGTLQDLPVNDLPGDSRVMVIGNNQVLFYVEPAMVYASAFDESPITGWLQQAQRVTDESPGDFLARRLRTDGFTHLWLGYSELDRLHATYGFDADVTSERLRGLVRDWKTLTSPAAATVLYEVPGE